MSRNFSKGGLRTSVENEKEKHVNRAEGWAAFSGNKNCFE